MKNKIENIAVVSIEGCGKTIEITSNEVVTTPVKLRIEKTQECNIVQVGENIKYTIEIENECGDLDNLTFEDRLDPCTEFVENTFRVNREVRHPEVEGNTLTYNIGSLESCETLSINFEAKVTEACCACKNGPEPIKSAPPTIRHIEYNDMSVHGTGVPLATIYVEFPDGEIRTGAVNNGGNWNIGAPYRLTIGQIVKAWQVEQGKAPSEIITSVVGQ